MSKVVQNMSECHDISVLSEMMQNTSLVGNEVSNEVPVVCDDISVLSEMMQNTSLVSNEVPVVCDDISVLSEMMQNTSLVSNEVSNEIPVLIQENNVAVCKDISGLENINELYEKSITKKWIKQIPVDKTILLDDYNRKEYFKPIADIILDSEISAIGKKQGNKKRKTLIQFVPKISNEDFNKKTEWLYLLVINNRIVKIGGTRTGLKGRVGSYLCGHHIEERGKSGDCSKTNGFIYNTFEFYLQLGCKIEMYGYELPKTEFTIEIFGKETKIIAQTYHAYESTFLEDYKKKYNDYPLLSDNCDPDYKDKET